MTTNNIDFANMASGGSSSRYNVDRKEVNIEPMKATGDIKEDNFPVDPKGLAKASPKFEKVEKEEVQDEEAKAKAIAEQTKKVGE